MAQTGPDRWCTRLAPSPTGALHLGHARTFWVTWLEARSIPGRQIIMRLEDLDGPRQIPGAAEAMLEDLAWLGLDWDGAPIRQSDRLTLYDQALHRLAQGGHLYACHLSRADLEGLATAPHGEGPGGAFPAHLRPAGVGPGRGHTPDVLAQEATSAGGASWRLIVPEGHREPFVDMILGSCDDGEAGRPLSETVGDFVLRRRDGVMAYQLAVVVDDLDAGVTHVIRGRDLYPSTTRQRYLWRLLAGHRGLPPPTYGHVGLCLSHTGDKLSKRDGALSLRALRERGLTAGQVLGILAPTLGLPDLGGQAKAGEYLPYWQGLSAALGTDTSIGNLGYLT